MSKQTIIIIGALLVALVGVVIFTQTRKSPPQTQTSTGNQSEESTTKGSIKSLLSGGKNVTCTLNYPTDQGETKGTVYVAGKKMRGDFTVKTADNKEMDSHMIQDEEFGYFWSSAAPQGTKMKVGEVESADSTSQGQVQTEDINKDVDMRCSPWSVDNSKFTPPSDVKFTDISEMMKQVQGQTTNPVQGIQKTSCDQITDPAAKAQCLQTLGGY